ncbi:ABC transporter permease [Paenibacillus methanolicus]|uniref:Putative aldouronate transport system permease protein n=1 Tax=Paenibacillus methanolicus TaxID=582686 RepID=A0A5S5CMB8_9BACL|nr:ABC transporter permease subunit [Paenibacillus methanolicus]TYP79795.1 putative aldouronate transport system permease protein [Paenibacillus methanolicus]
MRASETLPLAAQAQPERAARKQHAWLKRLNKFKWLLLMTLPGVLYLFVNNYIPMYGVILAFKNYTYTKGIWGSDWAGWKNFEFLFISPDAYTITRNTVLYNLAFIVLNLVMALLTALLINEIRQKKIARFYQSAFLLPHIISMVVVSYLVYSFLNMESGMLNRVLSGWFGIEPISWYSEAGYWPYILVIVNAWKHVGYLAIIYFAAVLGINREFYEAAAIDGATKWRQMTRITIPLITPVIITMTLLSFSGILRSDFGLFYQVPMNTGALTPTTNTIDTFVYRALLNQGDIGMSSAAGLYQSVVCLILVVAVNAVVRRINKQDALF